MDRTVRARSSSSGVIVTLPFKLCCRSFWAAKFSLTQFRCFTLLSCSWHLSARVATDPRDNLSFGRRERGCSKQSLQKKPTPSVRFSQTYLMCKLSLRVVQVRF
eukprot:Lithocolla_globosa_v1_NODE_316_length_4526_cov_4.454403.p4 type:complete len:104 gc:universal NODE_316_length_4526_cov_4.454403:2328-2017(-)